MPGVTLTNQLYDNLKFQNHSIPTINDKSKQLRTFTNTSSNKQKPPRTHRAYDLLVGVAFLRNRLRAAMLAVAVPESEPVCSEGPTAVLFVGPALEELGAPVTPEVSAIGISVVLTAAVSSETGTKVLPAPVAFTSEVTAVADDEVSMAVPVDVAMPACRQQLQTKLQTKQTTTQQHKQHVIENGWWMNINIHRRVLYSNTNKTCLLQPSKSSCSKLRCSEYNWHHRRTNSKTCISAR